MIDRHARLEQKLSRLSIITLRQPMECTRTYVIFYFQKSSIENLEFTYQKMAMWIVNRDIGFTEKMIYIK